MNNEKYCLKNNLVSPKRLATLPINNRSGKSMVLAMATTTKRATDFDGQSKRLYKTSCRLLHNTSNWKLFKYTLLKKKK